MVNQFLDFKSFRVLNSSHPYKVGLSSDRTFHAIFNKASLNPALVDWLNSQLIFQFALRPIENLPNSTVIENTVRLVSDCQPELISNQVESNYIISKNGQTNKHEIEIIPNPFDNYLEIQVHSSDLNSSLKIFNTLGQEVFQLKKMSTNRIRVLADAWASGIYHIGYYQGSKVKHIKKMLKL